MNFANSTSWSLKLFSSSFNCRPVCGTNVFGIDRLSAVPRCCVFVFSYQILLSIESRHQTKAWDNDSGSRCTDRSNYQNRHLRLRCRIVNFHLLIWKNVYCLTVSTNQRQILKHCWIIRSVINMVLLEKTKVSVCQYFYLLLR